MNEAGALFGQAYQAFEEGRFDAARALARRIEATHPRHGGAQYVLGLVALSTDDVREAVRRLDRAVKATPMAAAPRVQLARAFVRLGRPALAAEQYRLALAISPDHAPTWAAQAETLRALGRLDEAERAVARALTLDPDYAEALALAGEIAEAGGDRDAAIAHYRRALVADPTDRRGAALALARLGAAPPPERAPAAHVRAVFDQYAERFDEALLTRLDYRAPELLADLLKPHLGATSAAILDLGCGTGLTGKALRPLARHLEGIDLSPRMIERARALGLYDRLSVGDLLDAGPDPDPFDAVVAADTLVYVGDLDPVLARARACLRPRGLFAFTVERLDGDGYAIGPAQRYAHSETYLRQAAARTGFDILTLDSAATRREAGRPVPGYVVLFRASERASR
jgi:predicted TPR repeat methyltransferase